MVSAPNASIHGTKVVYLKIILVIYYNHQCDNIPPPQCKQYGASFKRLI